MSISNTDAKILAVLEDGRNVASNIADELGEKTHRNYVSTRLKKMRESKHVHLVGRQSNGLYEISQKGEEALRAWQTLNEQRKDAVSAAGGE